MVTRLMITSAHGPLHAGLACRFSGSILRRWI